MNTTKQMHGTFKAKGSNHLGIGTLSRLFPDRPTPEHLGIKEQCEVADFADIIVEAQVSTETRDLALEELDSMADFIGIAHVTIEDDPQLLGDVRDCRAVINYQIWQTIQIN